MQKEPWAEICWYFTESREQFRLGGNLQIIGEGHPDEKLQKVVTSHILHLRNCDFTMLRFTRQKAWMQPWSNRQAMPFAGLSCACCGE